MLMSGAVFIDRKNNKSAIASMTHAGDDMKRKKVCFNQPARPVLRECDQTADCV